MALCPWDKKRSEALDLAFLGPWCEGVDGMSAAPVASPTPLPSIWAAAALPCGIKEEG